jgi:hypothetical protein
MSVTKGTLLSLLFAVTGAAFTGPETLGVIDCIKQDDAKFCLKESDLLSTACCDSTNDCSGGDCTAGCTWAAAQTSLCTTSANKVMNKFLREFLMPYNTAKCPNAA